eukprot:CAMPEP_0177709366 /NCGR_PEP_ID=MMETSP0484_2-20121128/10765_1 /TAXON_ID=354590 /ORGANISM="Rhodomonas lens, Strain RHODO" /LENGTH=246 /DNA_ID=CAMNT_0019220979 /DNA_START=30 /DNA_END=767 /DNA_ORIENTATION=-
MAEDAPKLSKKEEAFMDAKQKGNDAISKQEWDRAAMFYTEALKSAPSHYFQAEGQAAACYSNRSFALLKGGQFQKALEDGLQCARLRPQWSKAHFRIAEAYRHMGQWRLAAESFRNGTACDPNDLDLLRYLADAEERAKLEGKDPDTVLELEKRLGIPAGLVWQARFGVVGLVLGVLLVTAQDEKHRNLASDVMVPLAVLALSALLGTFVRTLRLRARNDRLAPPSVRARGRGPKEAAEEEDSGEE